MADTILIVDDSSESRVLLAIILKRAGFEVRQAIDGETALVEVAREPPQLILLDVNMPGMNGFTVCERLKADPASAEIPVIFVSARDEAADKVHGLDLGGADYITKPFDKAEVLARVRSHLKIRALTQELRRKNQELSLKQERLEEDLRAGAAIQAALLPQQPPDDPRFAMAWDFTPCQTLGGDIFHVFSPDDRHLGLYILDVSGHGVPSSLITVSIHETLLPHSGVVVRRAGGPGAARAATPPRLVLEELDRQYPVERFEKSFTIAYALLDPESGLLTYASAGHPQPVLLRADGEMELLEPTGALIGMGGMLPFTQEQRRLRPGDRLVLYTDGVIEYQSPTGALFGQENFLRLLGQYRQAELTACFRALGKALADFGGGLPPMDDVSLLGLDYRRPG